MTMVVKLAIEASMAIVMVITLATEATVVMLATFATHTHKTHTHTHTRTDHECLVLNHYSHTRKKFLVVNRGQRG